MVQQMSVHEQGCKLIVSTPFSRRNKPNNFPTGRRLENLQRAFNNRCLTQTPNSRSIRPQQYPLCLRRRVPAWRS